MKPTCTLYLLAIPLFVALGCARSDSARGSDPSAAASDWVAMKREAEAKHFSNAARSAVKALAGDCPDRQYAMWKWWEAVFGERADYMSMSHEFGISLFTLYDQSSPADRQIIAEIFGRPHFDVSRSASDLRALVESNDSPEKKANQMPEPTAPKRP